MKKTILFATMILMAGSLVSALAEPKDDVLAAAKKLGAQDNYSWKMLLDLGPNSQFTPGPTEGKTEKAGATWLSVTFNDNTTEGVSQGGKVVVKTEDGWKTAEEAGGGDGGFNPATFMARRMQSLKAPAVEAEDLVSKSKELTKDGDAYSGELTEDGAKALTTMGFGRRNGQAPPAPRDAKGSVKFWLKDGSLAKYQLKVSGKRKNQDGDEVDFERTTTVEIKDIGATKINLPDEAKKKLS